MEMIQYWYWTFRFGLEKATTKVVFSEFEQSYYRWSKFLELKSCNYVFFTNTYQSALVYRPRNPSIEKRNYSRLYAPANVCLHNR